MEKYFLEQHEKEKLLAFCGYGHYPTAKIAFMGNEEGLGGYELKYGIKARSAAFGSNPKTYFGSTWRDGYFEIGEESDHLFNQEMLQIRGSLRRPEELSSLMLEYQARIMLHVENGFTGNWFQTSPKEPTAYKLIKDYYRNVGQYEHSGLYKKNAKVGSALLDLRPFPRRDEGQTGKHWPYHNIKQSQYNRAFSFHDQSGLKEEYKQLRDARAQYLTRAISTYRFPLLIGIGDKASKKNFFERYMDATFPPEKTISLTKDRPEVFISDPIGDWGMIVILSDFFERGFKGIGLRGLHILASEIIKPILIKNG
ncbi:hypothetical protein ABHN11_13215 [Brevibacillus centrosporus]|jgi:hypothetical protein|uniref:hypothetical protein n=1 Tax=Brevibacillus centrosporus TaxID=54910 RepID=UPI003987D49C